MRFFAASALVLSALSAAPALADDGGIEADETRVMDAVAVLGTYLANEKFSGTKTQTLIIDVPQGRVKATATRSLCAARIRRQTSLSMACATMCSISAPCIILTRSKSCADRTP